MLSRSVANTGIPEDEVEEKKKIGFIYEENHKFSADDKM